MKANNSNRLNQPMKHFGNLCFEPQIQNRNFLFKCARWSRIDQEARFDGKWVLRTNMDLPAERVALKYKELWQVEQVFRDVKSVLDTRPIFHKRDETIRGHVFCSFLALVLRKELDRRLESAGHQFEWADIKRDLSALQEVIVEENGKSLAVRTACTGSCGKVFQAVGVALPPTIREI